MQVRKITKNLTRLYLTFILQSNKNITAEKFYVLPRSYYHYIVDIDNAEQIHSHAEYAIKKLFSNYTLLVIQSTGTIWSGLRNMTRQLTIMISIQNGKEIELTTLQLSKIVFVMNWILVIDSLKTSSRNEEFMRKAILVYQY